MHISLAAEPLFHILGLPITNTLLMSWVAMGVIVVFTLAVSRSLKTVPGGLQNFTEAVIETMVAFIEPIVGRRDALRFFPLVATFFIFILFSNWLEVLPGLGSIGIYEEITTENGHHEKVLFSFLRSPSSDLNFTLALAIISVFAAQIFGILSLGIFRYGSKFISFKSPVTFFVGFLELISEFAKIISFSFRLFGNIFAGEVLLVVVGALVPIFIPLPFLGLEIFVGFVQALVFSMLTLVFLKIATSHH